MDFGVPREVRDLESRVGLSPAGVSTLASAGHAVYVETGAGLGAGFSDENYREAGGHIVYSAQEAYGRADVVAKVTRPTAAEHNLFRPGQTIFSFLHLPVSSPDLLEALIEREITAVSYELIQEDDGTRPVLLPASIIAGQMAPIIAGRLLRSDYNGRGILLSGLPGVPAAVIVIVGAGTLGSNAARAFAGLGAEVTVLDENPRKLQQLYDMLYGRVTTMFANELNLKRATRFADVLIGAVSQSGRRAPLLVSREMVRQMRPGSVIIDYAIDEGGCVETSRPTSLRNTTYVAEGIIHHCVPNMTAAYGRSTTYAITNAALPYLLAVGEGNVETASQQLPALGRGVTLVNGRLVHPKVAQALGKSI
ncbi:MAG: alanine dehydrogenase [Ardenticatenaceae bacterium]|nr:alanine dehydrogenase [Anaerolineales bacterium]MCB8941407.1 alanine dehydrogenase [Ardenticatenaceae bacterium]MCB8972763.1 alanine dehydrogenase [Ardenticatenaceae bacterium]